MFSAICVFSSMIDFSTVIKKGSVYLPLLRLAALAVISVAMTTVYYISQNNAIWQFFRLCCILGVMFLYILKCTLLVLVIYFVWIGIGFVKTTPINTECMRVHIQATPEEFFTAENMEKIIEICAE